MVIVWSVLLTYLLIAMIERRRHKVFIYFMGKDHKILYHYKAVSKSAVEIFEREVGISPDNPVGDLKKKRKLLRSLAVFCFIFWPVVYKTMNSVKPAPLLKSTKS